MPSARRIPPPVNGSVTSAPVAARAGADAPELTTVEPRGAAEVTIEYVTVAAGAVPLLALIVKEEVPGVVGTPDMTPVAASSCSPAGSEPDETANVGVGVPDAVTVNE